MPQILSGFTTAGMDDVLAVVNSRGPACYLGELFHRALRQFSQALTIIYLPGTGRVVLTDDSTDTAALLAIWDADTGGKLMLSPRSGQYHTTMTWEVTSDTFLDTGLADLLGNPYQTRTAWGMINTGMSFFTKFYLPTPGVLLDQVYGHVSFCKVNGEGDTALNAFVPSGLGNTAGFQFEAAKQKLTFE